MRNSLTWWGRLRSPTICCLQLENCNPRDISSAVPVQTWRLENQKSQWYKSWSESKGPRMKNVDVHVQEKIRWKFNTSKRSICSSPAFVFSGHYQSGWWLSTLMTLMRAINCLYSVFFLFFYSIYQFKY